MSRRRTKHSLEERIQAGELVINHDESLSKVSKDFRVNYHTLDSWVYKYKEGGIDGLKESRTWKRYSKSLKLQAVQDYLSGEYSLRECCRKHGISDTKVLRQWIKRYTSGRAIKSTSKGTSTMTKGRKTTHKERLEITQYCLAIDKNYQETAEKYQVSYQQVYQWVQKYEKDGSGGLIDRRGRGLESKSNLTDAEKLVLENKALTERNKYLEAEIGLLKKLEEIERRDNLHE